MGRPKLHDDALRVRLLDRAAELLSGEGPEALSLRRLAADVGTSTTAVYSLFGGKPGLLAAVYDEAVRRFGEHLAAVRPTDDPLADLRRLGEAYRRSALADPHLYGVMFSRRAPGFEPDDAAKERSKATFAPLVDAVGRAMERDQLPGGDAVALATGGSMEYTIRLLTDRGATDVTAICALAAPEGLRHLEQAGLPVRVVTASIDERLNDSGFIVPGLGDAGDRQFGAV